MKSDLRKSQLNRRLHLPQDEYLNRSKKIQTNIVESEMFQEVNLIACYLPIKNEVDTSYIIKSCFDLNKLIVLPKIILTAWFLPCIKLMILCCKQIWY